MIAGRALMFAAGVAAGVWASVKARRAAYRLSAPGVVDQAASWRLGIREFGKELGAGMAARRAKQLESLAPHLTAFESEGVPVVTSLHEEIRGNS